MVIDVQARMSRCLLQLLIQHVNAHAPEAWADITPVAVSARRERAIKFRIGEYWSRKLRLGLTSTKPTAKPRRDF